MSKFTYIELFAGIGGFRQALDKLGGECVFASEIDKFAKQAYATLYSDNHLYGDITKIKESNIPNHELIVAGIPCQAFSVAGKRRGFEDTRGTLFFDVARIAKEKRPKVIWIENVKGLVGHDKGRTLDTIVQTLNDFGYTFDFNVLNSKYFGVPQNRERIFIVAVRDDLVAREPWAHVKGTTVVPKGKRRLSTYEGVKTFNFDWPTENEVTTRLLDVLENEVDEKYYLSEEKTSKLIAQLRDRELRLLEEREEHDINAIYSPEIISKNQNGSRIKPSGDPMPTLTSRDRHGVIEPHMVGNIGIKGHDSNKRVYSTTGISPTLTTMGGGNTEPKIAIEYSRKEGIGKERDIALCLSASDWRGLNRNQKQNAVIQNFRIRKLTPLECWRLQGFSDVAHEAVKAAGISDTQRYKMAGNAVTVNVVEAIAERLLPYLSGASCVSS
ncbi:DNA (cytosine-5-)-methyltransferase [Bacillus chungangensis]|uniref:Cytosine-specific methyltransferase n=1 Tax=Bacillus chungangensis TaxID=587633 RepID=A0ABT9WM81_9BACI|nr:DNA (cytosine-5-)-methyltransferase [Bacillus chungangensis]MDQ0174403.1 DNA (cytosine-5)-methyltransferase 1 [Bacillus chungangensis]